MYAIIINGGKQYMVEQGSVLKIDKINENAGSKINFERVLMLYDGSDLKVGSPYINGVKISATVLKQEKNKKIIVFKYKKRKKYSKKYGHRQHYTKVVVNKIELL